jgi:hypothetical protein
MMTTWIRPGQRIEEKALHRCARILDTRGARVLFRWEDDGLPVSVDVATLLRCWRPVAEPGGLAGRARSWWSGGGRAGLAGLFWAATNPRRALRVLASAAREQRVAGAVRREVESEKRKRDAN